MGGNDRASLLLGVTNLHRGDLNVTRFPSERLGGSQITSSMKEFSNFIFK